MTDSKPSPPAGEELPQARVDKRKWKISVVWIVPLLAALVAAYLVYDRVSEIGPKITIQFSDVSGIKPGQTPIKYRGVPIGEVKTVELTEDQQHALVSVRLRHRYASMAREGSVFWIIRPEVGVGNITGLGTVITGPEIGVLPGSGKPKLEFVGLERSPVALEGKGLKIVLRTSHLNSLRPNSPVYYRGVEVGSVQDVQLGRHADAVDVHVFIRQRYVNLVRDGSRFWNASGAEINAGLFRGVEVNIESLRSLVAGGIAFASPNDPNSRPARGGTVFTLYEKPEKEWLEWAPKIPLPSEK